MMSKGERNFFERLRATALAEGRPYDALVIGRALGGDAEALRKVRDAVADVLLEQLIERGGVQAVAILMGFDPRPPGVPNALDCQCGDCTVGECACELRAQSAPCDCPECKAEVN